jgi:hypothetical protein
MGIPAFVFLSIWWTALTLGHRRRLIPDEDKQRMKASYRSIMLALAGTLLALCASSQIAGAGAGTDRFG